MVILQFAATAIAVAPVVQAQPTAAPDAKVTVEARVAVDSSGCPTAVELWLLGTSDSIAGVEAAMAWDRPDVAYFIEAQPTVPKADSTRSPEDSLASLFMPEGKTAVLEIEGGLLADWGLHQARLRTKTDVKVIAVADFLRAGGATPIPGGATGLLFRLPVALHQTPIGAPTPDSAVLYFEPGQFHISNMRGDLLDVVPPQPVMLRVAGCPALRPRR
ncbi:MAG TPA: hypothetical protein VM118_02535 [Acidobacteriota bacterium]|nr:hypothetical protein [Acidobacteriota bacterium]